MELNYKAIGKRIKIARINAEITQEQLSEKANLSPSHMSNIETGTTKVSLSMMIGIANALGVTLDDLLCDSIANARPQFEKDIQQILDSCNAYEIRIVKDVMAATLESLRSNENFKMER